jgi:hypothetical protein
VNPEHCAAWETAAAGVLATPPDKPLRQVKMGPQQFLVLITCKDERDQVRLLEQFIGEGLECRALIG